MPSYVYFRKQFVPLSEAKIGVMTHCLHYGTAVFEGIRGNWNADKQQLYLFRLKEHYERLLNGCRILKIDLPYIVDELCQITVELVARCGFQEDIYVRPMAYKRSEAIGVRLHNLDSDFLVFAFHSVSACDCQVSTMDRIGPVVARPKQIDTALFGHIEELAHI